MAGSAVDVGARVSQYEVTSAPVPGTVGRGRLRLVWVRPPEVLVDVDADADADAAVGAEATGDVAGDAAGRTAADEPGGGSVLAVLDAYRITRVPGRLAS